MKNENFKRVGTSLLALTLAVCITGQAGSVNAIAAQQPSGTLIAQKTSDSKEAADTSKKTDAETKKYNGKKSETVYVTLDNNGKPTDTIVSVWLHNDSGKDEIIDKTNLSDITVLKGGKLSKQKDNQVTWELTDPDLYYQGKTNQPLPVILDIQYLLDGKPISAEELAGRSGHLEINIKVKNQMKKNVILNGKNVEMSYPLTVITSAILSEDVFSNVTVSDGKVISDGGKQAVILISMPGMKDSLNIDGYDIPGVDDIDMPEEFTIAADVVNFEMDPIMTAISGFFPDVDTKSTEIQDMLKDLEDLQRMQNNITTSDPNHQIRSIFTNASMTKGAQTLIDDIYKFYDLNLAFINVLPKYVTKYNVETLDEIRDHLHNKNGYGYGIDAMKLLYSKTPDALAEFAINFDMQSAKLLLDDMKMLDGFGKQYGALLADPAVKALLHNTEELGLTTIKHAREAAAITDLASSLKPELIGGMAYDFATSGLSSLSDEQWQIFIGAGIRAVGASNIKPDKIASLLHTSKAVVGRSTAILAHEYGINIQNPEELQKFLAAGNEIAVAANDTTQMLLKIAQNPAAAQQLQKLIAAIQKGEFEQLKAKLNADLKKNEENIALLKEMKGKLDVDPSELMKGMKNADLFLSDMRKLMSVVDQIDQELTRSSVHHAFEKSYKTVDTLVEMKDDLFKYRDVCDAMRETVKPSTVDAFADVFTTLDRLQAEGAVDHYVQQVNDLLEALDRKDLLKELADENTIFTAIPENFDSELKFVMKTEEIKMPEEEKPVVEVVEPTKKEKVHNIFSKIFKK